MLDAVRCAHSCTARWGQGREGKKINDTTTSVREGTEDGCEWDFGNLGLELVQARRRMVGRRRVVALKKKRAAVRARWLALLAGNGLDLSGPQW